MTYYLRLGVSICLDVISIEISISTPKKYQSRRSRKSRQFSKVSLDDRDNLDRDRDFSILSRHHHPDPNISIEIEIYRDLPKISIISRSRSRSSYNFHKSRSRLLLLIHFTNRHLWKDVTFHSYLLVKISQKCREISINLEKSR